MRVDLKNTVGMGLALLSQAPFLSDGVRLLAGLVGGAILFVSFIAWLWRMANARAANPARAGEVLLSLPQARLLSLIARYQRQFAASKLVVDRKTGELFFDADHPKNGEGPRLVREMYGTETASNAAIFESLVESIPPELLRFFSETRWGDPFVVGLTEAGQRYLADAHFDASEEAIGAQRSHAYAIIKQTSLMERQRNEERHAEALRKEVRNALGKFVIEAEELEVKCRGVEVDAELRAQIAGWYSRVVGYLRERLDEGYVARFQDNTDFRLELSHLPPGPGQHHEAGLIHRRTRLLEFIKELR